LLVAFARSPARAADRPNIVIIYTDDQGYGDTDVLNPSAKFPTPNIDRLAREGLTFIDGHCADTVCTPSRYGLLTGRYCWRTTRKRGVMGAEGPGLIAADQMTLASLLRDHGYRTAMVGKWHLGMRFGGVKGHRDWSKPVRDGPIDHGFDYFYGIPASMNYGILTYIENDRVTTPPRLWTTKKPNRIAIDDFRLMPPYRDAPYAMKLEVAPNFKDEEALGILTRKAVAWIGDAAADARGGQPFFLYLALTSPHKPVCPAQRFRGRSEAGAYGDFMIETDYRVGEILGALDKHGLARDTLVVFTSDNGPETTYRKRLEKFGHASAGELRGGKRDIYEGGHRVPFLMRWPAVVAAGRSCREPVSQTDLLATFAAILGVELPANAGEDSYSLLPALRGEDYPRPLRGPLIHHSAAGYFAIRDGRWKLNLFRGSGGSLTPKFIEPRPGEAPYELYDLRSDIRERRNLYDEHPEIVFRLKQRATKIVTTGRSTPGRPQANDGPRWWPQLTWIER